MPPLMDRVEVAGGLHGPGKRACTTRDDQPVDPEHADEAVGRQGQWRGTDIGQRGGCAYTGPACEINSQNPPAEQTALKLGNSLAALTDKSARGQLVDIVGGKHPAPVKTAFNDLRSCRSFRSPHPKALLQAIDTQLATKPAAQVQIKAARIMAAVAGQLAEAI
jgi:hypothetical protein